MDVRIYRDQPVSGHAERDYVRIQTTTDPRDDTVTLVTIQRVTEKASTSRPDEPTAKVKTLVQEQPMSPDNALSFAQRYAERKHIPVVYAETQGS